MSDTNMDRPVSLRSVIKLLIEIGELRGEEFIPPLDPPDSHRGCCYCTDCWYPNDDCVCIHNQWLKDMHDLETVCVKYPSWGYVMQTESKAERLDAVVKSLENAELYGGDDHQLCEAYREKIKLALQMAKGEKR